MLQLFLLAFFYRVPEKIGRCNYLRHYSAENISNTLNVAYLSVVFFVDNTTTLDFSNFAIKLFRKQINFVIADKSAADHCNVTEFPSVVQFQRSKLISIYDGKISTPYFAQWCRFIVNEYSNRNVLYHSEEIRLIFENREIVLFGINQHEPPKDFKKDIPFYMCDSSLFSFFNITVKPGYYLYRKLDRQLTPIERNYHSYIKTKLTDLEKDTLEKDRLVLSYFFNPSKEANSTIEMEILQKLSSKHQNVYFAPVYQPLSKYRPLFEDLIFLQRPFLIVWNTSDLTRGHRWISFENETIHTLSGVENFLNKVESGELHFSQISEKAKTKFELVNKNFFEKIESMNKNAVVLFSNSQRGSSAIFHNILKLSRKHFPDVSFLEFNLSHNELPAEIPVRTNQSYFLFFKRNRRASVELGLGNSLRNFFENIVNASGNQLSLPNINYDEVQEEIQQENEKSMRLDS